MKHNEWVLRWRLAIVECLFFTLVQWIMAEVSLHGRWQLKTFGNSPSAFGVCLDY